MIDNVKPAFLAATSDCRTSSIVLPSCHHVYRSSIDGFIEINESTIASIRFSLLFLCFVYESDVWSYVILRVKHSGQYRINLDRSC